MAISGSAQWSHSSRRTRNVSNANRFRSESRLEERNSLTPSTRSDPLHKCVNPTHAEQENNTKKTMGNSKFTEHVTKVRLTRFQSMIHVMERNLSRKPQPMQESSCLQDACEVIALWITSSKIRHLRNSEPKWRTEYLEGSEGRQQECRITRSQRPVLCSWYIFIAVEVSETKACKLLLSNLMWTNASSPSTKC